MPNYNTTLQSNNIDLQAILDSINELPEADGVELPGLSNEGAASDLLSGKELIDAEGNVVTGTFSIDTELSTQDDLITQIQAAVDNLPEAGSSGGGGSVETITITYSSRPEPGVEIYYIDETMTMQHAIVSRNASYTIIKGTIFIVTNYNDYNFDNCALICGNSVCKAFYAYKEV